MMNKMYLPVTDEARSCIYRSLEEHQGYNGKRLMAVMILKRRESIQMTPRHGLLKEGLFALLQMNLYSYESKLIHIQKKQEHLSQYFGNAFVCMQTFAKLSSRYKIEAGNC